MPLLLNEIAYAKQQIELYKEIFNLYELIEWGGLTSNQWTRLHALEKELSIPGSPATCIADYIHIPEEVIHGK